jgi:hypothetical protein
VQRFVYSLERRKPFFVFSGNGAPIGRQKAAAPLSQDVLTIS